MIFGRAANFARSAGGALGRTGLRLGKGGTIAAAAGIGLAASIMDTNGSWGTVAENVYGDREALRFSVKAGIMSANRDPRLDREGFMQYYYGRPYNAMGRGRLPNRVSGAIALGAYNTRNTGMFPGNQPIMPL